MYRYSIQVHRRNETSPSSHAQTQRLRTSVVLIKISGFAATLSANQRVSLQKSKDPSERDKYFKIQMHAI
jgi:hypothetical protein